MDETFWTLLEIEPTRDEDVIRRAYARRLKDFRPDENPQGFQMLVGAKDTALAWAQAVHEDLLAPNAIDSDIVLGAVSGGRPGELEKAASATARPHTVPDAAPSFQTEPQRERQEGETSDDENSPVKPGRAAGTTEDSAGTERTEPADAHPEEFVFARLDEIVEISNRRPWGVYPEMLETGLWLELFDLAAASLSFQRHNEFLDAVGRNVASQLAGVRRQEDETINEFARGHGFAAVVEVVEQQCRFAERPAILVDLCGPDRAMLYFSWLAHAQSARGILSRRAAGPTAYVNERTGLPTIPEEDRVAVLETPQQIKFYDEMATQGRWPFRFDFRTLLLPTTRLMAVGLTWQSCLFIALLIVIWVASVSITSNIGRLASLACIPLMICARLVMATRLNRLAIGAAVQRVMRADRRGRWDRRQRLEALRNEWRDILKFLFVVETSISVLFLVSLPITLTSSFRIEDGNKPVEAAVSEIVVSALEAVANDDKVADGGLFNLINDVIAAEQSEFRDRDKRGSLKVSDLHRSRWLEDLRRQSDQLSGNTWIVEDTRLSSGPVMATPSAEREKKLRVLADQYRAGSPDQRMKIERTLVAWEMVRRNARGPQGLAAVWAAIPPQTSGPNLDAFPEEMRRQLLDGLLAGAIENKTVDEVQLVAQFNWLLTVSDDRLAEMAPMVLPIEMTGTSGEESAAERYLREHADRPDDGHVRLAVLSTFGDTTARRNYFDIARACLDLSRAEDRMHMRRRLAENMANLPVAGMSTKIDLWRNLALGALGDPICYRKASWLAKASSPLNEFDDHYFAYRAAVGDVASLDTVAPNSADRALVQDAIEFLPANGGSTIFLDDFLSPAHRLLGTWSFRDGNFHEAILQFDEAIREKDECSENYASRSAALEAIGDHERAKADYHKAFDRVSQCGRATDLTYLQLTLKPLFDK